MKAKEADRIIEDNWRIIALIAEKASLIFRMFGWTWGLEEDDHIPSIDELKETIEELCKISLRGGNAGGSGRLMIVPATEREDGVVEADICLVLGSLAGKVKASKKKGDC